MGLSNMVYTGANHTRFHHAIGCLHLMQKTVRVLRVKGVAISEEEENALCIAILLHDIGHGPFSHALEHSIVDGISHEEISLQFMDLLNKEFKGKLSLAIQIFKGLYPRKFMHQLISSQLDIDRLDYLKRDSFYTGVAEGNVSSDRLIAMMDVVDEKLVIENKGVYSVEKFLISRRFMYWQVYLHKTGLVAENMLVKLLKRAKELASTGFDVPCSRELQYFLQNKIGLDSFDENVLNTFSKLDDYDVYSAMKMWLSHKDTVLSNLSSMLLNRNLLKIELHDQEIPMDYKKEVIRQFLSSNEVNSNEVDYFVFSGQVSNRAYVETSPIQVVKKNGELLDVVQASDQPNLYTLSNVITKHFICYPKNLKLAKS